MTIEQDVRAALGTRADAVDSTPLSGPALRASATRHRRRVARRRIVTVVVAAVVAGAVLVVPAVLSRSALPPAATGVDTWPARGDLAYDAALAEAARTAWNAAPVLPREQPHRDVRVLLATRTMFGRYVMVTGFNALGHRRLAVFSDDPRDSAPYRDRLRLRSDAAFPTDRGLLTHVAVRRVGSEVARRSLLLVVGPPDLTEMRWRADTDEWTALPSTAGVAASIVPTDYPDIRLRAYRGERRVAEERASERLVTPLYAPDDELMLPERDGDDSLSCEDGVCVGGMSGTFSTPGGRGALDGVHRPDHLLWEDMAEQAEQLWLNWAVPGRRAGSKGTGPSISGLLPDRTGVHLVVRSVNDVPEHLVLYVDRPEWPLGRLFLVTPYDGDQPPRAVSALVLEENGMRLVVFAGRGVRVRYRIAGGAWMTLRVSDGIGSTALLGGGFGTDAVDVETSFDGEVTVGKVDTSMEVDPVQ